MEEQSKPSEHLRLELQVLGDTDSIDERPPPLSRHTDAHAAGPDFRVLLEECLHDIDELQQKIMELLSRT